MTCRGLLEHGVGADYRCIIISAQPDCKVAIASC